MPTRENLKESDTRYRPPNLRLPGCPPIPLTPLYEGDAPPESPEKHTWRFFPLNWAPPPAETDHAAAAQGLHCSVPQWNPELSWHGTSLLSSALYCGLVAPSETNHEHHNTAAGRGAYTTKPLSLSAKHGVPYLVGNPHPTWGTCYGPSSSWLLSAREARAEPPTG